VRVRVCVVFLPLAMADGADPLRAPERGESESVGGNGTGEPNQRGEGVLLLRAAVYRSTGS
jgi:hypothetical protein